MTALVTAVAGGLLIWLRPELTNDDPTTFATLSGLATLYGVAFAIIEVYRAKSAANFAARRAKQAADQVRAAYGLRDVAECQSCIEFALQSVEDQGAIPISTLSRIVKLYSAEFSADYLDEKSAVRNRVAMVESYALLHRPNRPGSSSRVREVLIAMAGHLSASAAQRISQEQSE